MDRGSERKVPHIGTDSEEYWSMDESLNQPSSVKDYSPMGFKLLLYESNMRHVWCIASIIRKRIG